MNRCFSLLCFISVFFNNQALLSQSNLVKRGLNDTISHSEKGLEITQMIIAYTDKRNVATGKLYGVTYINNQWKVTFDTIGCSVGIKGFANFEKKVEGDGKTPSGKFPLGAAFGYKDDLKAKMNFIELQDTHYWVSDTASERYNKLINFNPQDAYSEKMKRNDHLYKYGIIIEYNTQKVVKGKGSAIFIHIERRKGSPTTGCIAVSEEKMKELITWIDPQRTPSILMGTKTLIDQSIN